MLVDGGDTCKRKNRTCQLASVKTGGQPPVYNRRAHKCTGTRLKRSCDSNQTLSGYWEVNGISDAAGYDLSQLKPESSWALIQAEPRLAESILPASTST